MALRIHLYNERKGPLVIRRADPIGINDLSQIVKRSSENEGVIWEIILDLEFIKEARAYIKNAYETDGGIDAIVHVVIYDYNPNSWRWEHYGTGQINFNKYDLSETGVTVNIEQSGIAHRIINLMETDVDLESAVSKDGNLLPKPVLHTVTYHSKTIQKASELRPADETEYVEPEVVVFGFPPNAAEVPMGYVAYSPMNAGNRKLTELESTIETDPSMTGFPGQKINAAEPGTDPINPNAAGTFGQYWTFLTNEQRMGTRKPQFIASERADMNISVSLRARVKGYAYGTETAVTVDGQEGRRMGKMEVIAWFERRKGNGQIYENNGLVEMGRWTMGAEKDNFRESEYQTFQYNQSGVNIQIGDEIYVYLTFRVYGLYDIRTVLFGRGGNVHHDFYVQYEVSRSFLKLSAATFAGESSHKTMLLYEVCQRCAQYLTGVSDCFYSELLGRTDLGYAQDGEAALIGLTSGNKLRLFDEKHLIANLKDILDFLNARYCIGYGFEVMDGRMIFRIEKRAHFYNKDLRILSLGPVYDIRKNIVPGLYWKTIEYGYSGKLDIGQTNGIDEFNTLRRAELPLANAKNRLSITTKLRASGHQIEYQRRLQGSSEDSKLDDENFVTSLVRVGTGFRTKSMEGYEVVEGVRFPETGYNYDISPARMLREWRQVLGSNLVRSKSKRIRWSYGEYNYSMRTKPTGGEILGESEDLDLVGTEPIFDAEEYRFSHRLTRDQMKIIKANPYGYIEFTDSFGFVHEGYISPDGGIEHDPNKGTAEFVLRKVHRGPLERHKSEAPRLSFDELLASDFVVPTLITKEPAKVFIKQLIDFQR